MTIQQLVAGYDAGRITAHEMVVDCLTLVDPDNPAATLDQIPPGALPWLAGFLDAYQPVQGLRSFHNKATPSTEQILAAKVWLDQMEGSALVLGTDGLRQQG